MLTFAEFTAARTDCACLQAAFQDLVFDAGQRGHLYPDGLYIEVCDDGSLFLRLIREGYTGTLQELEAILYAYYLDSADESEWPADDVRQYVMGMMAIGDWEKYGKALRGSHADYCDDNQIALDIVAPSLGLDADRDCTPELLEAAADLQDRAAPYTGAGA